METLLHLLLPSLLLPLSLSAAFWWLLQRNPQIQLGLSILWLPSYIWLIGLPSMPPAEAQDWLWVLLVMSIVLNLLLKSRTPILAVLQTVLLGLVLGALAWPVLVYQFNMMLVVELTVVVVVAFILYFFLTKTEAPAPTLSLAISSSGLGLIVTLSSSLLIGQLAGALMGVLGVFAFHEFRNKSQQPIIKSYNLIPVLQIYLTLLVIARIFAEIPLVLAILLLAAPVVGFIAKNNFGFLLSAIVVIAAVGWLLLTSDSSSYY